MFVGFDYLAILQYIRGKWLPDGSSYATKMPKNQIGSEAVHFVSSNTDSY